MEIINITKHKGEFFKILGETDKTQVGVMTIAPGRDSGPEEIHQGDQCIYVIEGEALVLIGEEKGKIAVGEAAIIPAGSRHHIWNNGATDLFCLTLYAPPEY